MVNKIRYLERKCKTWRR